MPLVPVTMGTLFAFPSERVSLRLASRLFKRSCRSACKKKQPSIRGDSLQETLQPHFRPSRKEVKKKGRRKLDPGFSLDLQTNGFYEPFNLTKLNLFYRNFLKKDVNNSEFKLQYEKIFKAKTETDSIICYLHYQANLLLLFFIC